jgi:hypothetical protein
MQITHAIEAGQRTRQHLVRHTQAFQMCRYHRGRISRDSRMPQPRRVGKAGVKGYFGQMPHRVQSKPLDRAKDEIVVTERRP